MSKTPDVVIIGGGVIGCSIAYRLAQDGIPALLLEKGSLGSGASGRCGAMIWSNWLDTAEDGLLHLGLATAKLFSELEQELGTDLEYTRENVLKLSPSEDSEHYRGEIANLQRYYGVQPQYLRPEDIKKLAPYLDVDHFPVSGAYHVHGQPANASANPFLTVHALAGEAGRLGAEIRAHTEVTGISVKGGRLDGVTTTHGSVPCRTVVNAAGAWSSDVARLAGIKIPTMPYRENALVTEALEPLPCFPEYPTFWGRQTRSGQIILGEEEIPPQEPGYDTAARLDFLTRMSSTMQRLMPRLGLVKILRQWGGVEDVTPDELPILGRVEEIEGLILACGCHGYGFSLSQAMGKAVADIICERQSFAVVEQLNLSRFGPEFRKYPSRWYGSTVE